MVSPLRLLVLLAACLGASAFTSPVGAPSRITQSRFQTTFAASQVRQSRPLALSATGALTGRLPASAQTSLAAPTAAARVGSVVMSGEGPPQTECAPPSEPTPSPHPISRMRPG